MLRTCYTNNTMVVSRFNRNSNLKNLTNDNQNLGGYMSTNKFTLNANVYTGSFTKKDGTTRTMRFLKENAVPNSLRGSGVKPRYLDSKHEVVFDLDQNGWRVFNHNTVIEKPSFSRQEVTING
jgi:hypothetical protein